MAAENPASGTDQADLARRPRPAIVTLRDWRSRTWAGVMNGAADTQLAGWGLYAAYTWTANPILSTLQSIRFYVPALGAIALLGSWLVTRLPRRASLAAVTSAAAAVAMFGLGAWPFAIIREFWLSPMCDVLFPVRCAG